MKRYPFPGLTKHERRIVDEVGAGNYNLAYVFPKQSAIEKLKSLGIIREIGKKKVGNGWSTVSIPEYEMPIPEHIKWCDWCAA